MLALEFEHQLIGDIYDAAIQPTLWPAVVQKLTQLARADKGNLLAYDSLNSGYFLFHSHGVTPDQLQLYQDGGFAALDQAFTCRWADGLGIATANHLCFASMDEFQNEAGRLYTDFFSRVGIHYQAGALLERTEFRWSVLGLHRSAHAAPFEADILASISRLTPHLRRALQIHRQLTYMNETTTRIYKLLDHLTIGVFLLDASGRVRYANARAESAVRAGSTLRVTSQHHIMANHPQHNIELDQAIAEASRASRRENRSSKAGGVIGLRCSNGGPPLMITVTPLSGVTGYEELTHDGITTAIFTSAPGSDHMLPRELLRKSFDLSEREIDLCQAFLNHPTIEGAATQCGVTESTTRTYIKSVYEKTGQHSQAALMRLLMGLTLDFEHIR